MPQSYAAHARSPLHRDTSHQDFNGSSLSQLLQQVGYEANLCLKSTLDEDAPPRSSPSSLGSTKRSQAEMVQFMELPTRAATSGLGPQRPQYALDTSLQHLIQCIVTAADGRKAADIVVLQVEHVTTLTSALVILSGNSRPQNQAICAAIQASAKEQVEDAAVVPIQGTADSGWMLLDYGSVMVHVMTPKSRLYYNVEGQWRNKGGVALDISQWLLPLGPPGATSAPEALGSPTTDTGLVDLDDPFWS
jgi:ribosome-associated protein